MNITWLITGNFNGFLDDGGTLSAMTMLQRFARYGAKVAVHVVCDSGMSGGECYNIIKEWRESRYCRKTADGTSCILRKIPVYLHRSPYKVYETYRHRNSQAFIDIVSFNSALLSKLKPNLVITTQEDVFSAAATAKLLLKNAHFFSSIDYRKNPVYKHCKKEFALAFSRALIVARDKCLVLALRRRWHRPVFVLPPIIDYQAVSAAFLKDGRYITFIDYCDYKGAVIFDQITRKLPRTKFLLIDKRGLFTRKKWQRNVTVWPHVRDMRQVYAATKLLLVPTLMEQTCQRVVLEAMSNGIPVLASSVPGLKDLINIPELLYPVNLKKSKKDDYYLNPVYHIRQYMAMAEYIAKLERNNRLKERIIEKIKRRFTIILRQEEKIWNIFMAKHIVLSYNTIKREE